MSQHIPRLLPNSSDLNILQWDQCLADELDKFLYHQDEPVGSASVYAQYKVFELAKTRGIRVLLDGQGADEVLAGYTKYVHWFLQEMWSAIEGFLVKKKLP